MCLRELIVVNQLVPRRLIAEYLQFPAGQHFHKRDRPFGSVPAVVLIRYTERLAEAGIEPPEIPG